MGQNESQRAAALFDLDGVVFDTEPQYSFFWAEMGRKYHPEVEHFEHLIKGQTLTQIFDRWFDGLNGVQEEVTEAIDAYEQRMVYEYVPGVEDFLAALRRAGVFTAVVTSSNDEKMSNVYRAYPQFKSMFNRILTSEDFSRSKPDPDCYLLGAKAAGLPVSRCVVFEDSFNGLKAGRAADMKVIGLSTTNAPEAIAGLCDMVIPDFLELSVEKVLDLLERPRNNV